MTKIQKNHLLGGGIVVDRIVASGQDTLKIVIGDTLRSTTTTINEDGGRKSDLRYTAFGEVWNSSGITLADYRRDNIALQ